MAGTWIDNLGRHVGKYGGKHVCQRPALITNVPLSQHARKSDWIQPFKPGPGKSYIKIHQPQEERQEMSKTMYDSHLGGTAAEGNQKSTPIFMLDDAHLENILRVKAKNFCITRQRFSDAPRATDPMVTAMGSVQAWNADALQKHTRTFMEDFQPYVCEAAVRGGTILAQATESLREVTRRDGAVVIETQALLELESETLEEP